MKNPFGSTTGWLLVALCVVAGLATGSARAAEAILKFNSVVEIAADGTLDVTETIRVRAEGDQIRRGIYRDFPLTVEDASGEIREVGFDLVSVERDGAPEPYHTERSGRFMIRIYVGDADIFLQPGVYTYRIRYRTDRQIRYFDTYDELFWNVTGNGWDFPIEDASAVIDLPEGADVQDTVYFTGSYGETAKNARAFLEEGGNRAVFTLTAPLGPREGLTVGVKMAKGVVAPPSEAQLRAWFWRDNRNAVIALAVVAIVFLYYLFAWWRVGRDPPKGVMVPRWDAPEGVSPALANYIDNKGFSSRGWHALSAAAINLAVKGYVTLEELAENLVIQRTDKRADRGLPVGEAALLRSIGASESLTIAKEYGSRVQRTHQAFVKAIENEHRSDFYRANIVWAIVGVVLSALGIVSLFVFGDPSEPTVVLMVPAAVFGGVFVLVFANLVRSFSHAPLAGKIVMIVVVSMFAVMLLSAGLSGLAAAVYGALDPLLAGAAAGLIMINVLFYVLMGAPTPIGRRMMDGIEGLKTYLRLAEQDRMNLAGAPQMSPQHFETLLPYAVALGLEKPWSQAFEVWLASAAAGAMAASYSPMWYHGRAPIAGHVSDTFGSIGSSMASSFTASMPAPKSSSSGFSSGGGFSGGGGGGGGGGGW